MTALNMPLNAVRGMIPWLKAAALLKTVPQRGQQIAYVDLRLIRTASDAGLETFEGNHRTISTRTAPCCFLGTLFAPVKDRDAPSSGFTQKLCDVLTVTSPEPDSLRNRIQANDRCPL